MHNCTERHLLQCAETLECDHIAAFYEHVAYFSTNSMDHPAEILVFL